MMDPSCIDIETLLPHRGRMKLVEEIVALDEDHAVSRSVVRNGWPLCDGRSVSAIVLIELVAQTAAVNNGWELIQRHGPDADNRGWIVGIKSAQLLVDQIAIGTTVTIQSRNQFQYDNFREIRGVAKIGDQVAAEVVLQLIQAEPAAAEGKRQE